jgi:hypothetical protein
MCTDTRAAFLEYLFAILCICDIEQHFIEFLATNRWRYVVWLLADGVCERIREIGYVCIVYRLEDLLPGEVENQLEPGPMGRDAFPLQS